MTDDEVAARDVRDQVLCVQVSGLRLKPDDDLPEVRQEVRWAEGDEVLSDLLADVPQGLVGEDGWRYFIVAWVRPIPGVPSGAPYVHDASFERAVAGLSAVAGERSRLRAIGVMS